jgi:DNA invertase Pin-like site-specific DNA recombinase
MDKIDIDKIRDTLKNYPPCLVAKETGITYQQVYDFLRQKSDNPTLKTLNSMIDFINNNESK